ncbi:MULTISPECIES: hypothetical protein [unclassified Enterococcus]|uniref:hypothetical protein n=1 Tax=unclassified Enterococcus TaxID=2608891 RepID=UPI001C13114B|nr:MULTISPECIES: hypothetical protein [unclassified Enterococcus]
MAIGLKFEKVAISGKDYLDIAPSLLVNEVFGKLTYRVAPEPEIAYEDDLTQPRRADGSYPQMPTGEILGVKIGIKSSTQHETKEFTIIGMMPSEIEALNLKFNDEVELQGIKIAYYAIPQGNNRSNSGYKLFAERIIKKVAGQQNNSKEVIKKEN